MAKVFCEKHLIADCACDQPHKAEKRKLKVKRERTGFWAEPKPTARRLALDVKSSGGTLAFGKDKTLPKPTTGTGQAQFLQTVATFAPKRRGLKPGQRRREPMPGINDRCSEVRQRDFEIRYDREMVAMGCRSAMVKVVKGNARPVTAMEIAIAHADIAVEVPSIMAMLKAAVSAVE